MPLLGQHLEPNVTTRSPRNFSKPFSSPSSPVTPHSAHEFRDLEQLSSFTWRIPQSKSPPLRRKPSRLDLTASGDDGLRGVEHLVTRGSATLAPLPRRQQELELAPSALPRQPTPQHRTPTSPSLSSSITTLQSTPTHSPIVPGGADGEWQSTGGVQVSSKRKFPFVLAKRLPRRATREWCVYAAVIEGRPEGLDASNHSAESESESDSVQEAETQPVAYGRERSVRFAGLERETLSGTEQSSSGEDKNTNAGSTYTLSKFKFPQPPGHTWAGTFGKLNIQGEPRSC